MTEPTTAAGRALVAAYPGNALDASTPEFIRHQVAAIRAIEAEARAAALDEARTAVIRAEGLDVERLARAIAGDPDDRGLRCEEYVARRLISGACGREAYAFVRLSYDPANDQGRNFCRLHTTLATKKGAILVRLVEDRDRRDAEQSRWLAGMRKARGQAERIAAEYARLAKDAER